MEGKLPYACHTISLMHILGKRWAIPILENFNSARENLQFRTIEEDLNGITPKNLSRSLKDLCLVQVLEKEELIESGLVHTEYRLTEKGMLARKFIKDTKRLGICMYGIDASCINRKCSRCPLLKGRQVA
ncbi:MAG: helix-turn-helix transcriptional regulator [Candidatus Micrarchaeota archaeon]|nr:helix-turn-helix transcriptional regulator [Candidatus Micrarchaeota archaeon]